MARTTQLVQSSRIGPHRLPNPAALLVNTSLAKSLGPHPHWSGSSRGQSDNAERQHEHQDRRDITSRQIEFSSSSGNQIDVEHPSDELDSHAPFSASDPPHGANPSTSAGGPTAGTTNDPAHGQHPNIHPSTDGPESFDSLDPSKLYELGQALCNIALRMLAQRQVETLQRGILAEYPVPPCFAVQLPVNPHPPLAHSHTPATRHLSTSVIQSHPQPHSNVDNPIPPNFNRPPPVAPSIRQLHPDPSLLLNPSFALEGSHAHSQIHELLPPSDVTPGRLAAESHPASVPAPVPFTSNTNTDQRVPASLASGSGSGAGSTNAEPAPDPRRCPMSGCNKRFHRKSDLQDHMHKHGAPGRHRCESCGKGIAYRNNLSTHEKKCKGKRRRVS